MLIKHKKAYFYLASFLIAVVLIELSATALLKINDLRESYFTQASELYRSQGIDFPVFRRERRHLYADTIKLNPYKWYQLESNYKGRFHITDNNGFRNAADDISQGGRIGIATFGGSTVFGVTNKQTGTIPALMQRIFGDGSFKVYNFGIGAYSTSNEIYAFSEVSRIKTHNIRYALFYDGVNEVFNYIQKLQDNSTDPFYDNIGYPYYTGINAAIRNENKQNLSLLSYELSSVLLYNKVIRKFSKANNIHYMGLIAGDIREHAQRIAEIYINNIKDIHSIASARGIETAFIWQPSLFSVRNRNFSERENEILRKDRLIIKELFDATELAVTERMALAGLNFYNFSDQFDKLGKGEYFFDPVHVTEEANEIIAKELVSMLQKQFRLQIQ